MLKILSIVALTLVNSSVIAKTFAERPEVKQFVQEISVKNNLDSKKLLSYLNNYESVPSIIEKISHPAEGITWDKYRKIFMTEKRISQGVDFCLKNKKFLDLAESKTAVPTSIIAAIIGVETFYGNHKGSYPVIQSLATLAFDYAPRSKFFRQELEHFLILAKEHKLDPTTIKGSYAGAIGIPQFMPSSYRNYAVDFTKKTGVNLSDNTEQSIYSVANYLHKHGWKKGKGIAYKILNNEKLSSFTPAKANSPLPNIKLSSLKSKGLAVPASIPLEDKIALLKLNKTKDSEYWIGEHNFYVITRYNHNVSYALAVHELSNAISERLVK